MEDVIGDNTLTEETIRANNYTLEQILANHQMIDNVYSCKICLRKLSSRLSFIAHLRLHTGEFVAHCHLCGNGFTRVWYLKDHEKHCSMRKGNKQEADELLLEDSKQSIVSTQNKVDLVSPSPDLHNEKFSESSKHVEDIGDISLTEEIIRENKYTLRQVFESHKFNKENMFQCKVCKKCVTTKKSFIAHLRKHTGDFIGHCRYCGRGAVRKHQWVQHEKICAEGRGRVFLQIHIIIGK